MGLLMTSRDRTASWLRVVAVTAAAALTAVGCGSDAVQGSATTATPTSSTSSGGVDVASLDVGNYPTKPSPPLGMTGTESKGKLLQARELANFVVGPWEIDPGLLKTWTRYSGLVLKSADALNLIEPKAVAAAAGRHPFVNGFYSARSDDQTVLINAVVRFTDPAAATAAAGEMVQAALDEPASGATRSPVTIPGHSDAQASSYPFTDVLTHREKASVNAFTAHGAYVLVQAVQSYDGLETARGLVAKTLDAQKPLVDQFTPAAPADFAALPLDPTGLLARTILLSPKEANVVQNSTYDVRGALHFQSDPVDSAQLLADAGVDVVASGKTTVYRATNPAGAASVVDGFAKQVTGTTGKPAAPVPGLPASKCVSSSEIFYCVGSVDRYVVDASSGQLQDAQQQIAAQYAILSSS